MTVCPILILYRFRVTAAKALALNKPENAEIATFVSMVDKFFDYMNVGKYTDDKHLCNPFK